MLTEQEALRMPAGERLARLARTPAAAIGAIGPSPDTALARRPAPASWAPTEVLCHLRDAEELFRGRLELMLTSDTPRFLLFDPDRAAEERQYLQNDGRRAAAAFDRRRGETLAFLRALEPAQWSRAGLHPARGRMTIEEIVAFLVWHDENHLAQLLRALHGEP